MRSIPFKNAQRTVQRGLRAPHMLAFLPALCLSAFWAGGEIFLVFCALFTPLIYAATGGFGASRQSEKNAGIPNPTLEDVARDFLEIAHVNGQTTACFQIGVTGLEDIARTLGDEAAREARITAKARLVSTLRNADHVFQIGDARFIVLIAPGFHLKLDTLLDLANRLRRTIEDPLSVTGTTRYLSAAIGIASSLNFGRNVTPETWTASAAQALSEAVLNGQSATRVWSDKLSKKCHSRRALREDLGNAFERGEIQAHFQPQVSIRSGHLIGVEALARWEHPIHGLVKPAEFLRALEDSGQINQLGRTMLTQALSALHKWDDAGLDVRTISVNFSAAELRDPTLPDHVKWELDRVSMPAQRLGIEVLESIITKDADDILRRNLTALSELGCRIDLDDFGTGHASITRLQMFPITRVKIDQSFVKGADTSPEVKRLLGAVLAMTEQLNIEALAEGVETVGENGVLRDLGCPYAQGFLFAQAMTVSDCTAWIKNHQSSSQMEMIQHIRRVQ